MKLYLSTSESIWGGVYMPHKMDTQGQSAIFRKTKPLSNCGAFPEKTVHLYSTQQAGTYHVIGKGTSLSDTIFQFN